MKKILLFILALYVVISGFSQKETILLTFNAKDSITQSPLVLDSIYVKNIEKDCDTSLYNPDTVLILNVLHVGINELSSSNTASFTVMQNVPNPFTGSTLVKIYLKRDGELNLAVYDNQGKKLSQYHNGFEKGWHLFGISTNQSGLLFLNVTDNTLSKTIKILSTSAGNEGDRISYKGQSGQDHPIFKSGQDETGFIFYFGNHLQFTGYVDGYHQSILSDSVVTNKTYTFAMLPVSTPTIPTVNTANMICINQVSATSGGEVISDGGAILTARGVFYGTSSFSDSIVDTDTVTGIFISYLTGLMPNTNYYLKAYARNNVGTAYGDTLSFTTLPPFVCGDSITICHVAGTVAPVTKTVTYGTVTNIPGEPTKCWITSNLGADHQATYVDDTTEASAGWYWQFNRKQGYKHDGTTRTPATTWINSINENYDWVASNDPCTFELGSGWRIPTKTEWFDVRMAGGPWTNWSGPWNSDLKLHAAGRLYPNSGSLESRGFRGYYWSSTQNTTERAFYLFFMIGLSNIYEEYKTLGTTLRCIRN